MKPRAVRPQAEPEDEEDDAGDEEEREEDGAEALGEPAREALERTARAETSSISKHDWLACFMHSFQALHASYRDQRSTICS